MLAGQPQDAIALPTAKRGFNHLFDIGSNKEEKYETAQSLRSRAPRMFARGGRPCLPCGCGRAGHHRRPVRRRGEPGSATHQRQCLVQRREAHARGSHRLQREDGADPPARRKMGCLSRCPGVHLLPAQGRQVPRRHPLQCRGGQGQLRPGPQPGQQAAALHPLQGHQPDRRDRRLHRPLHPLRAVRGHDRHLRPPGRRHQQSRRRAEVRHRTTARTPSARARTSSRSGCPTTTSRWSRTRTTGTRTTRPRWTRSSSSRCPRTGRASPCSRRAMPSSSTPCRTPWPRSSRRTRTSAWRNPSPSTPSGWP